MLDAHADADSTRPMMSDDAEAAALIAPIKIVETDMAAVMEGLRGDIADRAAAGFDVRALEEAAESGSEVSSYVLRFIRARLRELRGELDIERSRGAGTAISAHLPIHRTTARPRPGTGRAHPRRRSTSPMKILLSAPAPRIGFNTHQLVSTA